MIGETHITAVVIGRAGSRGLPNKNVLPVAGRPMIQHTIDDALASTSIDRVLVSTDGEAIANAAQACSTDVEIVMRPGDLASDTATVDSAVRHAVTQAACNAEIVVILYANVPVRPNDLIDRAVTLLASTEADSVQSYCDVGKYHPYWMMQVDGDDGRVKQYVANTVYRRQDLPPLVIPDGGVIAVKRESLFTVDDAHPHAFLGADRRAVITQPGDVVDVDTEIDLRIAHAILENEGREKGGRESFLAQGGSLHAAL